MPARISPEVRDLSLAYTTTGSYSRQWVWLDNQPVAFMRRSPFTGRWEFRTFTRYDEAGFACYEWNAVYTGRQSVRAALNALAQHIVTRDQED